jgi:acetylglutamate kinase
MKNILLKASGDVLHNPKFIKFSKDKSKNNKVVIICGGGTRISEALIKSGYKIKYDNLGRVVETEKEKSIVKNILGKQKSAFNKIIGTKNIEVIVPILKAGKIECHINGDNLAKAYYLGFDAIYVFTLKSRIKNKKETFKDFPKINVIGI